MKYNVHNIYVSVINIHYDNYSKSIASYIANTYKVYFINTYVHTLVLSLLCSEKYANINLRIFINIIAMYLVNVLHVYVCILHTHYT